MKPHTARFVLLRHGMEVIPTPMPKNCTCDVTVRWSIANKKLVHNAGPEWQGTSLRVGWGGAEATKRRSTIRTSLEVAARLMIQKSLTLEHVLRGRAPAALPACLALAQATGAAQHEGRPPPGDRVCVLCPMRSKLPQTRRPSCKTQGTAEASHELLFGKLLLLRPFMDLAPATEATSPCCQGAKASASGA